MMTAACAFKVMLAGFSQAGSSAGVFPASTLAARAESFSFSSLSDFTFHSCDRWPNKSPEPTAVGVFRYSLWSFGFS